jgi:hypothetical protein
LRLVNKLSDYDPSAVTRHSRCCEAERVALADCSALLYLSIFGNVSITAAID